MNAWLFGVCVAVAIPALILVAVLMAGVRVPMPRFRRRRLVEHDLNDRIVALHVAKATACREIVW